MWEVAGIIALLLVVLSLFFWTGKAETSTKTPSPAQNSNKAKTPSPAQGPNTAKTPSPAQDQKAVDTIERDAAKEKEKTPSFGDPATDVLFYHNVAPLTV